MANKKLELIKWYLRIYKQKLKDEFFYLQPIVVSKEKRYKVINGQQRLTTIYLILKYLQNLKKEFEEIKK